MGYVQRVVLPAGSVVVVAGTVSIENAEGDTLLEFESFDECVGIETIGGLLAAELEASTVITEPPTPGGRG